MYFEYMPELLLTIFWLVGIWLVGAVGIFAWMVWACNQDYTDWLPLDITEGERFDFCWFTAWTWPKLVFVDAPIYGYQLWQYRREQRNKN